MQDVSVAKQYSEMDWTNLLEWIIVLVGLFGALMGGYRLLNLDSTEQNVKMLASASTAGIIFGSYLVGTVLKSQLRR
jgi:hypothetical protein